jgi:hypothetical protein
MSSVSFENLTSRLPREREALLRLKSLIESAVSQSEKRRAPLEYTFEHLFEETGFIKPEDLALALAELVSQGAIEKKIRVVSPTRGGGIGDFESILEVPQTIHDWRADREVSVSPDELTVIYRLPHHGR